MKIVEQCCCCRNGHCGGATAVPEIDASSGASAIALLSGSFDADQEPSQEVASVDIQRWASIVR